MTMPTTTFEFIGWLILFVWMPLIFLTFPIVLYGWRKWPVQKAQITARLHKGMIHVFILCVFAYVVCSIDWSKTSLAGYFLAAVFGWLVLPIKHPSDYPNYGAWWADRRNWHRGVW